jgi:hypothetical protein
VVDVATRAAAGEILRRAAARVRRQGLRAVVDSLVYPSILRAAEGMTPGRVAYNALAHAIIDGRAGDLRIDRRRDRRGQPYVYWRDWALDERTPPAEIRAVLRAVADTLDPPQSTLV